MNTTKGQWRHTVSANGRHQISGDSGKQVCLLWNCKEREANASLIAAAPEMYELLERMHNNGGLGLDVHAKIESLLAKARGEK